MDARDWHTCNYYCQDGRHTDLFGLPPYVDPPVPVLLAWLQDAYRESCPRLCVHAVARAREADASLLTHAYTYCQRHGAVVEECGCTPLNQWSVWTMEFTWEDEA